VLIGFKHIEHKCSPPFPWGNVIQSSQAKISANDTKLNTISRKDIRNFLRFTILFIYIRFPSLKSNVLPSQVLAIGIQTRKVEPCPTLRKV